MTSEPARSARRIPHALLVVALAAVLAATIGVIAPRTASAQSETEVPTAIRGRVVNGTPGGEIPAGLEVVLLTVDDGAQEIIERDQKIVGTNGQFEFTNLVTGPGLSYRVVANAGDFTPSADLRPGESSFENVEVTIWDPTTSLDDISLSTYAILIPGVDRISRTIGVLTVATIVNSGNHVWMPDLDDPALTGLDLLRFNLPEGYEDLSIESTLPAGNILDINTGFALTNPVPPGEFDILLTYTVQYEGSTFGFPLRMPYGADIVRVLLPDGMGDVSAQGFGEPGSTVEGDTTYNVWQGDNYPRDSQLDLAIDSLPTPTFFEATKNFFDGRAYILVLAWVGAMAMLGLLAYAFFFARRRGEKPLAGEAGTADENLSRFPEYSSMGRPEIVQTIAELDGKRDAGEIAEEDYQARRAALKDAALSSTRTEVQPT